MNLDAFPSKNTFEDLHRHLLIPAVHALNDMENNGLKIDINRLKMMEAGYTEKLRLIEDSVRSFSEVLTVERKIGKKFNLNSGDQIYELFFKEMGLSEEGILLTKSQKRLSTGKATIEKLKDEHELVGLINQHKKYAKLYSTYVKGMWKHIGNDGMIHCNYQPLTVTGRLMCSDPNLQNQPKNIKADEIGFDFDPELNIKHLYIPYNSDYELLQADYSQIELRILALYSLDDMLIGIFQRGEDIHIATGQAMADIVEPGTVVNKESKWRSAAKAINFGIVYLMGDKALAGRLKTSEQEAAHFKSIYFERMPLVESFIEEVEAFVKANRYVTTMFGNYRRLAQIASPNKFLRFEALRQAVNMPIQGTAGQYTIASIININNTLKKYRMRSKLVCTVHDSIIACTHKKETKDVAEIIKEIMFAPKNPLIYWDNPVPLVAELELSDTSWANMKNYVC